jgi:hypothetical protein
MSDDVGWSSIISHNVKQAMAVQAATTTTGIVLWNIIVGWFLTIRPRTTISNSTSLFASNRITRSEIKIKIDDDVDDCVNKASAGCCAGHDIAYADNPDRVEDWISALWWSLKLDFSHSLCSKELKEALFAEGTNVSVQVSTETVTPATTTTTTTTTNKYLDCGNDDDCEKRDGGNNNHQPPPWIVRGIPERPLYKEVAKRLFEWNRRFFPPPTTASSSSSSSPTILAASDPNNNISRVNVIVPAEALGFEELAVIPAAANANAAAATNENDAGLVVPNDDLPPRSRGDIPGWLLLHSSSSQSDGDGDGGFGFGGGDASIHRLLGIRNTVGSLLPAERRLSLLPSKRVFLETSAVFLQPKQKQQQQKQQTEQEQEQHQKQLHDRLTVAAKARSKHAHRAVREASFFGIARGPVSKQNKEASKLVRTLLDNCVWINCHVFGGLPTTTTPTPTSKKKNQKNHSDDTNNNNNNRRSISSSSSSSSSWVVEIRQEQGYGARWLVEESSPNEDEDTSAAATGNHQCKERKLLSVVTFRGFLEPQMEDGHERKWRH